MKKLFSLLLVLAVVLTSCGDEVITLDPDKTGHAYYPLELGASWIFEVTETNYTNNVGETEEYQIRERIDQTTTDQSGREWYRVEISRRANEAESWRVQGVKLLSKSAKDFRIDQNNLTLVHMVYPAENGKSWIFNPLNSSETKAFYYYDKIGQPFEVNGVTYDNTLVLVQQKGNPENVINLNDQFEVLAFGVGPVYRSFKDFDYCNGDGGQTCEIGTGYIVSGTQREESLVEFAIEE